MRNTFRFTVSGKNLWELDDAAGRVLEGLVGSLIDQGVDYEMSITPGAETYGSESPATWHAVVEGTVDSGPDVVVYNRTKS